MLNTEKIAFSESTMSEVIKWKAFYPEGKQKSALLPLLHLAQKEFGGYLSVPVMDYVATLLDISPIEVYEVASFYTMFHLKPTGEYVLEVCRTGPCQLMGSDRIMAYLEKKLGIKDGETTTDGLFMLRSVECLASCGTAPMMQVGERYCENLTPAVIDELLLQMKSGSFKKVVDDDH